MVKPMEFVSMALDPRLLTAVADQGWQAATPVQTAAIPPALEGRDVLACAATGSGKTGAFVLPMLQRLKDGSGRRTRALVLVPTRELAAQVEDEVRALASHTEITSTRIIGGVGMGPQVKALGRGVEIVVATPGRLLDHLQRGNAKLEGVEVLVLDEADRILDMGFLPDIRRIMKHLSRGPRQTLFFSATMPDGIVKLAAEMLHDPARVNVERKQAPAEGVAQALFPVPQPVKVGLLAELLQRETVGNAIVFCRTKHRANRVAKKLDQRGVPVARIHGNRSQKQRTEALAGFKAGRYRVIVATDILARGIDVESLDHVVNFDVPATPEDYIHRVGRTGRASATGDAFTFVAPEEESLVRAIERKVGSKIPRQVLADFDYSPGSGEPVEVPRGERIARIRAQRSEERQRAREKAERRESSQSSSRGRGRQRSGSRRRG